MCLCFDFSNICKVFIFVFAFWFMCVVDWRASDPRFCHVINRFQIFIDDNENSRWMACVWHCVLLLLWLLLVGNVVFVTSLLPHTSPTLIRKKERPYIIVETQTALCSVFGTVFAEGLSEKWWESMLAPRDCRLCLIARQIILYAYACVSHYWTYYKISFNVRPLIRLFIANRV